MQYSYIGTIAVISFTMFLNECARLSALWLSGSVSLFHSLYLAHSLKGFFNEWADISMCSPPFPSSAVSLDVGLSVLPALLLISPPHRTKIPNGTFWTQPNEADTVAYRCWSRSHSCCCCCRDSGALVLVPPFPSLSPHTHYVSAAPSPSTAACSFNMSCGYGEGRGKTAR